MLKTPIKIGLVFLKREKEKILDLLQKKEIIHLIELKKITTIREELVDLQTKIAQVKFALDFLGQFQTKTKKTLKERIYQMFSPSFIYLKEEQLREKIENFDFQEIVQKCENFQSKLTELEKEEKELKNQQQFYQEWVQFPYALENLKEIKKVKTFCGLINNLSEFEKELKKKTNLYELKIIPSLKGQAPKVFLLYHFSQEKNVKELLAKFEAKEIKKIESSLQIKKRLREIEERLKEIAREYENLSNELKGLLNSFDNLKILYDYFTWSQKKIEAELKSLQTEKLIFLSGWIDGSRLEELKSNLEKITKYFEIFQMQPHKNEKIPVIIENKRIIQPFEMIMKIYGAPKPNEIDPLPWLAPFFIFFFGFCVGDAGYGLILTILSFILIKLIKLPAREKNLYYLLFYGGMATFLMGIIFGSWFGITTPKMQLLDPIKNPLLMLTLAFLLGMIQLIFGIFLRMYSKIKNKMVKEALLEDLPWIYFIVTILLFGAKNFLNLPTKIVNFLILSGALLVIITHSKKTKNIILKPFVGTISLYGVMSYLSDALSYSRLVALGLSTTVVGYVVNLTALVIKDILPLVGIVLAGVVLVFGHIFNMVISSLGAFVHSMRLQFVEFLPKFLEGGGSWFKPFARESKYVKFI